MYCSHFFVSLQQINNKLKPQKRYLTMKKLFLPILLMVTVSAHAVDNPVLTIEGGQVQGVLADDHPGWRLGALYCPESQVHGV